MQEVKEDITVHKFSFMHLETMWIELEKYRVPVREIRLGSRLWERMQYIMSEKDKPYKVNGFPIGWDMHLEENHAMVFSILELGKYLEFSYGDQEGLKLLNDPYPILLHSTKEQVKEKYTGVFDIPLPAPKYIGGKKSLNLTPDIEDKKE